MFRILSLDGGGLRGSFGAGFLAEIERRLPAGRRLADGFDLLAGTSTGGILAAGLAAGLTAADLVDFYRRRGPGIFTPRPKFKPRASVRPVFPLANWVFKKKTGGGDGRFVPRPVLPVRPARQLRGGVRRRDPRRDS